MQLTNTTDYAIRIVCYLAIKKHRVTTAKLASELKIPESYIPKITKQLKKWKSIDTMEQILQKNKKNLSYLEHYKKTTNGIKFRNVDEKHSLIQIDNEKKLY